VEDLEDLPSSVGVARTQDESGSSERAGSVAAEVQRLAPRSVAALTVAAEVARTVERDLERASALLDVVLEVYLDSAAVRSSLSTCMLEAERAKDALALLQERLLHEPEDEAAQEVCAWTLERIQLRLQAREKLEPEEQEALARFSDRGLLYRPREALVGYVEERPGLRSRSASPCGCGWRSCGRPRKTSTLAAVGSRTATRGSRDSRLSIRGYWRETKTNTRRSWRPS